MDDTNNMLDQLGNELCSNNSCTELREVLKPISAIIGNAVILSPRSQWVRINNMKFYIKDFIEITDSNKGVLCPSCKKKHAGFLVGAVCDGVDYFIFQANDQPCHKNILVFNYTKHIGSKKE